MGSMDRVARQVCARENLEPNSVEPSSILENELLKTKVLDKLLDLESSSVTSLNRPIQVELGTPFNSPQCGSNQITNSNRFKRVNRLVSQVHSIVAVNPSMIRTVLDDLRIHHSTVV